MTWSNDSVFDSVFSSFLLLVSCFLRTWESCIILRVRVSSGSTLGWSPCVEKSSVKFLVEFSHEFYVTSTSMRCSSQLDCLRLTYAVIILHYLGLKICLWVICFWCFYLSANETEQFFRNVAHKHLASVRDNNFGDAMMSIYVFKIEFCSLNSSGIRCDAVGINLISTWISGLVLRTMHYSDDSFWEAVWRRPF